MESGVSHSDLGLQFVPFFFFPETTNWFSKNPNIHVAKECPGP